MLGDGDDGLIILQERLEDAAEGPVRTGMSGRKKSELFFDKCYDDKVETSDVQAERISDCLVDLQGTRRQITAERVLRARGKMMKNKANGLADCLVTEMLQCLPIETSAHVRQKMEPKSTDCC